MSTTEREAYQSLIRQITGSRRVVRYCPALAGEVGGVKAALLLSQLIYWSSDPAARRRGGWILKTVDEMLLETGLSKAEQQTARAALARLGVIEARLKGIPRIWRYRVNLDRLAERFGVAADSTVEAGGRDGSEEDDEPIRPGPCPTPTPPDGDAAQQPQPAPASPEASPADVGPETRPILGAEEAQLNKELKITTQITEERVHAQYRASATKSQAGAEVLEPAPAGPRCAGALPPAEGSFAESGKEPESAPGGSLLLGSSLPPGSSLSLGSGRPGDGHTGSDRPGNGEPGGQKKPGEQPPGGQPPKSAGSAGGQAGRGQPGPGSAKAAGGAQPNRPPAPPDGRHPAVGLVREVTGRSPAHAVFDLVIAALGEQPDRARFASVHQTWCARGYNPVNLEGQLEWYAGGIPAANRQAIGPASRPDERGSGRGGSSLGALEQPAQPREEPDPQAAQSFLAQLRVIAERHKAEEEAERAAQAARKARSAAVFRERVGQMLAGSAA